ncbi:mannose-1-phosphate guanylyltransferase/mannose-6-phosphate isomerase [Methanoculleus horonobensis]|jgi:mannose-1-phosphate guanylyltransferase/mannose-6-phosphate isomerase|uniref:mannose-1-phosphate guanylyltransferase/mannose-6-phosphate isomerase n=1 Tax=Methanoculleus horonobensis TaxID=528314 RepID=UPI00082EB53A|nr:mannose-1-phosphate guanylyltransferase/mannose-6-phosphate isomerase [Methanoculleus horonobensis]MDD3069616.1 mannose-1-phosphate guanylyltransferase/mannose-6-phosphate isomerase [Methanoculleus horonobensis]MDD4253041.1 mannose-1-phosphate guanylyltransferase/mannose-6-phosphate isomerase [Methanoculleus horonobensis]
MKTLILAGGSGTRLFPLSREQYPKQFIPLVDDESLFQKTVKRALLFSSPQEIAIVTNSDHRFLVRDQLAAIRCDCRVLVEPVGKNTLPAIYYGAREITRDGPDTVAVLPSDHLITAPGPFQDAFRRAERLSKDYLVVFGVRPTSPHTGYGYIRPGEPLGDGSLVDAFVEKPDIETAGRYVADGYLWNSGMFCFNAALFLAECETCAPEVARAFEQPLDEAYGAVPALSIDYGIMEKTRKAAVVPLECDWSDVGNFDALYTALKKNGSGNAVRGEHIGIDSSENLIIADRLIATVGVHNLAIVETKDAILVAARDEAQRVGEIAKALREKGDSRALFHTQVHRPWGSYTNLEEGQSYKIKRVTVPPNRRLSLQMHHHRSEHWVVVTGCAEVTIGGETSLLRNGESTFVPAGTVHRLANPGLLPLELIEVQIGEYTGEDDIIRFEDDFDRT